MGRIRPCHCMVLYVPAGNIYLKVAAAVEELAPEHPAYLHFFNFVKWGIKPAYPVFYFHQVIDIDDMTLAHLYKTVVDTQYCIFRHSAFQRHRLVGRGGD